MTTNNAPKLSVILPAFNAEKTLKRAIDSVLTQTFQDFELIVINDGSTDRTQEVIDSYRDTRLKKQQFDQNKGLIFGLNKGLEIAKGEYIARQDADDESFPRRFEKQTCVLDLNDKIGVVGSAMKLRNGLDKIVGEYRYPATPAFAKWQCLFKTPLAHSTIMMRRSLAEKVGGYNSKYKYAEDYELWTRVIEYTGVMSLEEVLVYYSIGGDGVSEKNRTAQDSIHIKIATSNIEKILGVEVNEAVIRALCLSIDRVDEQVDKHTIGEAIEVVDVLKSRFYQHYNEKTDLRMIDLDVQNRIILLLRKLNYQSRLHGVGRLLKEGNRQFLNPLTICSLLKR